ncbi:hypothetical protein [Streptomyces sp. NPDC015131]|uniref:hypothetical protein n=1 Tax=Streptomyces sp. NPDC015131 TaxID=3364941 RepID=UPI0037032EBE
MGQNWWLHAGRVLGAACGVVTGALIGASISSWTGAVVGAYGGFVSGTTIGSGFVRSIAGTEDKGRREGIGRLGYGIGAALGAMLGYWAGTRGIDRLPPMGGFFGGLAIGSLVVGLTVSGLARAEMLPPALPGLLCTAGAGCGAWAGTALGHPGYVATLLVLGCAVGLLLSHLLLRAMERAIDDHLEHGRAGEHERRGNWPGIY